MVIIKILLSFYFISLIGMALVFALTPIIEKNLDNCNPIKKWWRRHIIDYDASEPRPEGTTCDE